MDWTVFMEVYFCAPHDIPMIYLLFFCQYYTLVITLCPTHFHPDLWIIKLVQILLFLRNWKLEACLGVCLNHLTVSLKHGYLIYNCLQGAKTSHLSHWVAWGITNPLLDFHGTKNWIWEDWRKVTGYIPENLHSTGKQTHKWSSC